MLLIIWSLVFILALALLLKSADSLTSATVRLAADLRVPAFFVGLIVVSLGTALPELAGGISASLRGRGEIAVALAIGSTIANLLLVVGISAISAGSLAVRKRLVDLDASLFAVNAVIFFFFARDGRINFLEGLVLILAFMVYAFYVVSGTKDKDLTSDDLISPDLIGRSGEARLMEVLPSRIERVKSLGKRDDTEFTVKSFLLLTLGIVGLAVGAKISIDSLVNIADLLSIPASFAALTVMGIGVALPEIFIAISAVSKKTYDLAVGNVYGSSIINLLLVCGISSMIGPLKLDEATMTVAMPFLFASLGLLIVSGISRRIHAWEGIMYCFVYAIFLAKLFELF